MAECYLCGGSGHEPGASKCCIAYLRAENEALRNENAEWEGIEGRCKVGHNKRFTYLLKDFVGCVACERDEAYAENEALAEEARVKNQIAAEALRKHHEAFEREAALRKRLEAAEEIVSLAETGAVDRLRTEIARWRQRG